MLNMKIQELMEENTALKSKSQSESRPLERIFGMQKT